VGDIVPAEGDDLVLPFDECGVVGSDIGDTEPHVLSEAKILQDA